MLAGAFVCSDGVMEAQPSPNPPGQHELAHTVCGIRRMSERKLEPWMFIWVAAIVVVVGVVAYVAYRAAQ